MIFPFGRQPLDKKLFCPSFLPILALLLSFAPIAVAAQALTEFSGRTMGTSYSVKFLGFRPVDFNTQLDGRLFMINQQMSTYIAHSEISQFNRHAPQKWMTISPEFWEVVELAKDINLDTNGAFEPTLGSLVNMWGFGPDGRAIKIPSERMIQDELLKVGLHRVILGDGNKIRRTGLGFYFDLSAIAKGYAVDFVAKYLESLGVKDYMVEVGGEVRTKGVKKAGHPWKIGIEMPNGGRGPVMKVVAPGSNAVATSGDYRNYFERGGERFSHIIDPRTGRPIGHNLASVSVMAKSCAEADALATAFMVMGYEEAIKVVKKRNLGAMFILRNKSGFETRITDTFKPFIVD